MFHWLVFCVGGMRYALALVFISSLGACSGGDGGAVSSGVLSWTPPVQREGNVTPLALDEIAGYNIYYRTADGNYDDNSPVYIDDSNNVANVQVRLSRIPVRSGSYLIVVTTIGSGARESAFSAPELEVTF